VRAGQLTNPRVPLSRGFFLPRATGWLVVVHSLSRPPLSGHSLPTRPRTRSWAACGRGTLEMSPVPHLPTHPMASLGLKFSFRSRRTPLTPRLSCQPLFPNSHPHRPRPDGHPFLSAQISFYRLKGTSASLSPDTPSIICSSPNGTRMQIF